MPELELRGAGGEPVDLRRTIVSHGLTDLLPLRRADDARSFEARLPEGTVRVREGGPGRARVDGPPAALPVVRRMLRLDEDLSQFYELIRDDPLVGWATNGAGRLLRSPTVFEDVVKTICTTNCAWSGTVRMTTALVEELGGGAFPAPAAMAAAPDDFYRDVARAGYRGPYLRAVAAGVADGTIDLEGLGDPELPDEEVERRLLALPGVGPYAAAHVMLLIGRYRPLVLDSWTRPTYARLNGGKKLSDAQITRRFRRYGDYAGLAFWLFLTRDWVPES